MHSVASGFTSGVLGIQGIQELVASCRCFFGRTVMRCVAGRWAWARGEGVHGIAKRAATTEALAKSLMAYRGAVGMTKGGGTRKWVGCLMSLSHVNCVVFTRSHACGIDVQECR